MAAPKGGSGKSTVTGILAARAVQEGYRVALFDLNADRASLTQWWISRGEPDNPYLYEVENLTQDRYRIYAEGFEWLFIDTPPLDIDLIENAVVLSSAVIIPVRASIFDIGAITPIVEICRERRKAYAFLMSAADPQFRKLNDQARAALAEDGPAASQVSYRSAYINALTVGKAGFEIDKKLCPEVDALWAEVAGLGPPLWRGYRKGVAHAV